MDGTMRLSIKRWNNLRIKRRRKRKVSALLRRATEKQFQSAGVEAPHFLIAPSDEVAGGSDIIIRRDRQKIVSLFSDNLFGAYSEHSPNKIAAYMYWFSQCSTDIDQILVDASDGHVPNTARYAYSSLGPERTPLPDPDFFRNYGYRVTDQFATDNAIAWNDRNDQLLWRGSLNNLGLFSLDPAHIENIAVMQRLRMALKCKGTDIDFRFVVHANQFNRATLDAAGLVGSFIPTHEWGKMKYAIDIDGYTNAWANLLQRLKLGCCIFKVTSPFGFYQWYYSKLRPWEHFIPISADLSDLFEKIDWAKSNPSHAHDIAKNGQALGKSLTFESERESAKNAIVERESK